VLRLVIKQPTTCLPDRANGKCRAAYLSIEKKGHQEDCLFSGSSLAVQERYQWRFLASQQHHQLPVVVLPLDDSLQ
jgi:hypothetical protein